MVARNLLPASAQVLLTADNAASTVLHVLSSGQKVIMEMFLPFKKQPVDGSTVRRVCVNYCSCSGTKHRPQIA